MIIISNVCDCAQPGNLTQVIAAGGQEGRRKLVRLNI